MSGGYRFKVVVIGDGSVGKTTLILKYTEKRFRESYIPTIGVQWTVKNVEYKEYNVSLILWDIAGQDKFKLMRSNFYEGSDAVIIVFDVTSLISFDHVENWLNEVRQYCGNVPFILLGNKIDLVEERKVTQEMIKKISERYNFPYFETSAKTGENVIDMFNAVIDKTLQQEEGEICVETPAESGEERRINISDELIILEELIKNNEKIKVINDEFKTITNEIFRQNPYHEKLEEMTQYRLETLNLYPDESNFPAFEKDNFLERIEEWKATLNF